MPTPCSSCDRTHGKCQSCIRVDAVLTPERVDELRDAAEAEWIEAGQRTVTGRAPFDVFFARAISREVVGILAEDTPTRIVGYFQNNAVHMSGHDIWEEVDDQFKYDPDVIPLYAHESDYAKVSTPAASGIDESGGEAA